MSNNNGKITKSAHDSRGTGVVEGPSNGGAAIGKCELEPKHTIDFRSFPFINK